MGPNRFQCWWHSKLLGWMCDAYPTPRQADARLKEVQEREYFTKGLVVDMEEHLTGQEEYLTQQEFDQRHKQFTEQVTHV